MLIIVIPVKKRLPVVGVFSASLAKREALASESAKEY